MKQRIRVEGRCRGNAGLRVASKLTSGAGNCSRRFKVFSKTSSQDAITRAKAEAKLAAVQARQYSGRAREVASAQLTPLARNAQLTAGRGVYNVRVWAAPRVERTGVAVQERLAPRVSSMMVATARRMEPVQVRSRRRWPAVIAGIVMLGAAAAAGGLLRSQRAAAMNKSDDGTPSPAPAPPAGSATDGQEKTDTAQADVNGQVRTP
jgi:hypothetical protein